MNHNFHIFFVDDEKKVCQAVEKILKRHNYQITTFESAHQTYLALKKKKCHLLITDLNMPEINGMQLLHQVKKLRPDLPILIVTAYGDIPMAVKAIKNGANDFIEKPLDSHIMLNTIENIQNNTQLHNPSELSGKPISKAEMRVLKLIMQGMTNREIAQELNRSVRTIEDHRLKIMKKLNAKNNVDLVRMAMELGLS